MLGVVQSIIIKAVSICNLACTYCSAKCSEHLPQQVSPECVLAVFQELLDHHQICSPCKVIWHGGEPTLYDPEKADHIMSELVLMGKKQCVEFDFVMQTKGFSISPPWMRLIQNYKIGIGISCDGPEKIHDLCRKTMSKTGSYKNVMDTIRTFSNLKIPVSLLSVIDIRQAENVKGFYSWAAKMNLPIKLNPLFSDAMEAEDFSRYLNFLRGFLQCYLQDDADFSVEPLKGMFQSILNDSPARECAFSGNCGKHILCIDYSDRLSACGRINEKNGYSHPIAAGKIIETVKKIQSQAAAELKTRFSLMQCSTCSWFKICHAGCSAYLDQNNIVFYCKAIRDFWDFMNGDALRLLKKRLLKERELILSHQNQFLREENREENEQSAGFDH